MYVTPPASTALRWAAYAAALMLVALIGYRVMSAPKTPYQELRARVDSGWEGTYFDQRPFPVAGSSREASVAAPEEAPTRLLLPERREEWKPFDLLTTALLAFLVLGLLRWLASFFVSRHPSRRRGATGVRHA